MTTLTFSEVMNNGTHLKRRSLAVYSVYYTNCSGARRVTLTHCSRTALNAEEIKHLPSTSPLIIVKASGTKSFVYVDSHSAWDLHDF